MPSAANYDQEWVTALVRARKLEGTPPDDNAWFRWGRVLAFRLKHALRQRDRYELDDDLVRRLRALRDDLFDGERVTRAPTPEERELLLTAARSVVESMDPAEGLRAIIERCLDEPSGGAMISLNHVFGVLEHLDEALLEGFEADDLVPLLRYPDARVRQQALALMPHVSELSSDPAHETPSDRPVVRDVSR